MCIVKKTPRPIKHRDFKVKTRAVLRVKFHEPRKSVANDLDIPESTLRGWLNDELIVKTLEVADFLGNLKKQRKAYDEQIARTGRQSDSPCDLAADKENRTTGLYGSEASESASSDSDEGAPWTSASEHGGRSDANNNRTDKGKRRVDDGIPIALQPNTWYCSFHNAEEY